MRYYATVDRFTASYGEVSRTDTGGKLMVDRETFDYSKMNVTIVDADHPLPENLDCEEDSYYDKYDDRL